MTESPYLDPSSLPHGEFTPALPEVPILVVIPTYNEADNVERVLRGLFALPLRDLQVLVVDDNSPDGTAERVEALQPEFEGKLHLLRRPGKQGLGTAYVDGFRYALQREFQLVVEMDADMSHNPEDLPKLLEATKDNDVVVGSRYLTGVNVVNWPLRRLLLSLGGNKYARLVTGLPVKDCTSGYKCFKREVLEAIDLDRVQSDGYAFQIEMNFRAWKKGFRICEVPIIFFDREVGSSKMSKKIIREAVWMVWKLKWMSLTGRL